MSKGKPVLELIRADWPTLQKLGLATDEPAQIDQAHDKRSGNTCFIEIF